MQKNIRNWLFAAALTGTACALAPWAASQAQEKMPDDHMKMAGDKMKMSADEMKMASEHMDKMKTMAADHPQETTAKAARLMVMDKMAMHMAMDPSFSKMTEQSMSDPNMKKLHDDARKMADDPAQMARIQQDIMADPMAVSMVMHMARSMVMMHQGMMQDGMMHGEMMKDGKMKDMPAQKK